ncbi:MAG: hypothetical protein E7667_05660 [Ruminococcaceae bacterium]|nr:hypothetical protein [Oscillospiraceae bacterium]
MKILIAYATKHGTTEDCAKILASHLRNHEVTVLRVGKGGDDIPCVDDYDIVIFGSHIRMTKIDKALGEYLNNNQEMLISKRCAYFLCCGFIDCFEDYLYKNIPESLIENAEAVACFGGRLDKSRAKGMDRFIISAVRSEILGGGADGRQRDDLSLPTIMEVNISQFADVILGR